jgi:hypothetical protein
MRNVVLGWYLAMSYFDSGHCLIFILCNVLSLYWAMSYFDTVKVSFFKRHRSIDLVASENDVSVSLFLCQWCSENELWLVDAVHEGYLAGLLLVRISLVTQPPLRPGWHRYKCTNTAKVVYTLYSCNQQFVCVMDAIFWHLEKEDLKSNFSISDSHM